MDRGGGEEEEDTVVNNGEGVGEFEEGNGPELIDNISPRKAKRKTGPLKGISGN